MNLFLIGLPGSGKSTTGKSVAASLKKNFIDLDEEIEKQENTSIASIFATKGETYFREVEHELLGQYCKTENNFLMATGGGTPCFYQNMELIKKAGLSIFLDAPIEVIVKRMINTERSKRPLLADQNPVTLLAHVTSLREKRLPFYRQANLIFNDAEINKETIKKRILELEREAEGQ